MATDCPSPWMFRESIQLILRKPYQFLAQTRTKLIGFSVVWLCPAMEPCINFSIPSQLTEDCKSVHFIIPEFVTFCVPKMTLYIIYRVNKISRVCTVMGKSLAHFLSIFFCGGGRGECNFGNYQLCIHNQTVPKLAPPPPPGDHKKW